MELEVNNLTKKYHGGAIALDNIDAKFQVGVNALIGVNGAGKTTLMKLLTMVIHPENGHIQLDGQDILKDEFSYKRKLGYLPQQFEGYQDITAEEFMLYMATLKDMKTKEARLETEKLLELVSLKDVCKKKIATFSGGMKRRLGIAQALLNNPQILILDEPTVGLDPKERVKFCNMIAKMASDRIIIISTHIISDVESIASQITFMKKGKIVISGTRQEVVESLSGKVWGVTLTQQEADVFSMNYIEANYTRLEDGKIWTRVVADEKPHDSATIISPKLEDLFLSYLQEEGENEKSHTGGV